MQNTLIARLSGGGASNLSSLVRRFLSIRRNDVDKPLNFSTFKSLTHTSLKKSAFTLAEVLITLGIIGVVAAMTMPTLINCYTR